METDSIKIINSKDFHDQKNLTEKLIEIDYLCYGEIDLADEGLKEHWDNISKATFCFMAVKNDEPIGYFDFVVLNEEGVKKLLSGNLRDGQLEGLVDFEQKGSLNLYLVSMAVLSEYRGQGLGQRIWHFAKNYFIENNIKIKNLYTTIWTLAGHAFLKKFDYQVINKDPQGHEVVVMEIGDF